MKQNTKRNVTEGLIFLFQLQQNSELGISGPSRSKQINIRTYWNNLLSAQRQNWNSRKGNGGNKIVWSKTRNLITTL